MILIALSFCVIHVVPCGFPLWLKFCVSCPSALLLLEFFQLDWWISSPLSFPCSSFSADSYARLSPPPPFPLSFFLSLCMRSSCLVHGLRLGVDGRPAAVIQHRVHCLAVRRQGGGGSAGLHPSLSLCHTSTHRHTKRHWSHHVEPCSLNTQTSSSFVSPPSFPLPCCPV